MVKNNKDGPIAEFAPKLAQLMKSQKSNPYNNPKTSDLDKNKLD